MTGVMKVDGLDIDVGVEGVLVEENRAAYIMGHVEPTSKCHLPATCFSKAPSFPRRGRGFQL